MHPYFYHWHNRVELKPESAVLQPRWDAAENFSKNLSRDDACALLRLALFGTVEPEFSVRFSKALVVLEPTFPPERNGELLRVMATAALHSRMEAQSEAADAAALGLVAASFQPGRIQPFCSDLVQRASEYLASESERMRPTPNDESAYGALKNAANSEDWADNEEATKWVGEAILELGETMGRIAEENQFLWWLLGRRSSILNTRREKISSREYALLAAAEAAERVALLPPPASVESLIAEVLSQCTKATDTAVPLTEIIEAANISILGAAEVRTKVGELCPLHGLLGVRRAGGKVDGGSLVKLCIPAKYKISPTAAANQYFRELMFLRALEQLD